MQCEHYILSYFPSPVSNNFDLIHLVELWISDKLKIICYVTVSMDNKDHGQNGTGLHDGVTHLMTSLGTGRKGTLSGHQTAPE